jgi:CheY-like chemotaxis protein
MRQLHALIIDDSGLSRRTIMRTLADSGLAEFHFTEFENGLEALETARSGKADIVFVDMHMPKMGGIEFMQQLRGQTRSGPPAVLITAESNREQLAAAFNESGVDAVLLKPFDTDRLRKGLWSLIQSIPEKKGPWTVPHGECAALAVQEALLRACRLELVPEPDPHVQGTDHVIYGLFNLTGDVNWSLALGMDGPAAEDAASRFGGYPITVDHPDLGDAIGEIANIIAGLLKRLLNERNVKVEISFPSVLSARELRFLLQRGKRMTGDKVHFRTPAGRIWVSVHVGLSPDLVL